MHHCALSNKKKKKKGAKLKIHNILNLVLEPLKKNKEAKHQNLSYRCVGPSSTKSQNKAQPAALCTRCFMM